MHVTNERAKIIQRKQANASKHIMHKSPSRELKSNMIIHISHPYHHYYHTQPVLYFIHTIPNNHGAHTAIQANFFIRTGGQIGNQDIKRWDGRQAFIDFCYFPSYRFCYSIFIYLHILLLFTVCSSSCTAKPYTVLYTVPVLFWTAMDTYIPTYARELYIIMDTSIMG
jgi:hypothetical protein